MKRFRIVALLLTVLLCLPSVAMSVSAKEMTVVFEESFDDYDVDVNASATALKDYFVIDANAIGDGYIKILEDDKGNLYLKSHVFTQVYTKKALTAPYTFSLEAIQIQGGHQAGIFLRGTPTEQAFYEADGGDPTYANSEGYTGVWLYVSDNQLDITVKSYSADQPNKIRNSTCTLPMPEGSQLGNGKTLSLRFEDTGDAIAFYADDHLICTLRLSGEESRHADINATATFAKQVTLLDAEGQERMTVQDSLVCLNDARLGWATRVADLCVDSVKVEAEEVETEAPTESLTAVPTEAPTEAPTDLPTEATSETPVEDGTSSEDSTGEVTGGDTGCRSVIGFAGMAGAAAGLALAVVAIKKKKEN